MSRLSELMRELRVKDPALARELDVEVKALQERRAFGLNFERHVPETVELPGRPVRKVTRYESSRREDRHRLAGQSCGAWVGSDVGTVSRLRS